MTWNFITVAEHGADSDGMYPIPTGKGVGIEQVPGDGNPVTFDVFELTISRRVGDAWEQVYLSRGNPGQLIFTDKRVVITFKKVPKSRSMFVPIAAVQAVAGIAKHRGESLVGHLMHSELQAVAARNFCSGLTDNLPALRLVTTDATTKPTTRLLIEIVFTGRTKASRIGDDLVRRAIAYRLADPAFDDEPERVEWPALSNERFAPARKAFQLKSFGSHRVVQKNEYRARCMSGTDFERGAGRAAPTGQPVGAPIVPQPRPVVQVAMPSVAEPALAAPIAAPAAISQSAPEAQVMAPLVLPAPVAATPSAPPTTAPNPERWLPDPLARHELRFWDGRRWTQHVSDAGVTGIDRVR